MSMHTTLHRADAGFAVSPGPSVATILVAAVAAVHNALARLTSPQASEGDAERADFLAQARDHADLEMRERAWDALQARSRSMPPVL
ncbi:hypothetical protein GCM10025771_31010 [Niveibacterium umoris]|uniref:Uncharacterized protein n=1 Tax=Niveibacterium umoris TaxID=1193620 RepID=A0A840BMJ5_9RHOO|nr:hypothetical protein [Niveibacterium umoris]MBB4011707.1 hypothetical protein [Niveibacterium umoris]